MDFANKVVIVTGSSSGVGAACARLFAAQGALLSIIGRNEERLKAVAKECVHLNGVLPLCFVVDLTVDANREEIVKKTAQHFGKIDILVNCVGRISLTSLFDDSLEVFDELVAINLRVPYHMTMLCLPHMPLSKGGVIVNVFGTSFGTRPGLLLFSMLRECIEAFTKHGGAEVRKNNVRMIGVQIGITRTSFYSNLNLCDEGVNELVKSMVPMGKIIEPDEVARMVLYVASEHCQHLYSTSISVDGGISSS